jgi:uncharacterized membrane protein
MPWSITEIHPLLVHFPIALFSTGLFFDLLAELLQKKELEQSGFWCMLMGLVSCLFANTTGLLAFLEEGSISDLPGFSHSLLIWASILLFAVLFWVRIKFQVDLRYSSMKRYFYFLGHILAVGILFYGAHLGAIHAGFSGD